MGIQRRIWLINLISNHPNGISLKEINSALEKTNVKPSGAYNRMTLLRDRDLIHKELGLKIACSNHAHYSKYYVANPESIGTDTMEGLIASYMIVGNLLVKSHDIKDRVLTEAIPSSGLAFQQLLNAMEDNKIVTFTYRKYDGGTSKRRLEPYCLKLWNQRWYLLGHSVTTIESDAPADSDKAKAGTNFREFAIFSLDRISDVDYVDSTFSIPADFSAEKYFRDCYGILSGDGTKAERVVIRAYGKEAYYMRDLPLHHTQKELAGQKEDGNDYVDFEYFLRPSVDFVDELLSHADRIKVLEPQTLVDKVKERIKEMIGRYQ